MVLGMLSVEVIDCFGNDFWTPFTLFSVGRLQGRELAPLVVPPHSHPIPDPHPPPQLWMKRNVVKLKPWHLKQEHHSLTSYA